MKVPMNLLFVNYLFLFQSSKNIVESFPCSWTDVFMNRNQYSVGKCKDESFDYKISIHNVSECARKCYCDGRCAYFSYYKDDAVSPDNQNCYFYISCDLDNLQDTGSHWVSGRSTHGTCYQYHSCILSFYITFSYIFLMI